jgi:hypothetical protein
VQTQKQKKHNQMNVTISMEIEIKKFQKKTLIKQEKPPKNERLPSN